MNLQKLIIGIGIALTCASGAFAGNKHSDNDRYEYRQFQSEVFFVEGRVISATPIYQTYWQYESRADERYDRFQDNCRVSEVEVYRSGSNNGPAGAIIGGAIGAHVGSTSGRSTESTVVGAIAGSVIGGVIGNEMSRDSTTVHRRVERDCDREYRQERRELIGYDVRYRYNGREFTIQTQQHPGRYIQLKVEVEPTVR